MVLHIQRPGEGGGEYLGLRVEHSGRAIGVPRVVPGACDVLEEAGIGAGGIDDGEDPQDAAVRELSEETGITPHLVDIIAQSREEHFYDLPEELLGKLWKGKWRGQRQWWFLMRFKGDDGDINIETAHPEFSQWQWVVPDRLPHLIVPFKKRLYENIVAEFGELI